MDGSLRGDFGGDCGGKLRGGGGEAAPEQRGGRANVSDVDRNELRQLGLRTKEGAYFMADLF